MIVPSHQSGAMITIIYNLLVLWIILETCSRKQHLQQYLQWIKARKFAKRVLHSDVDENTYRGGVCVIASCAYLFFFKFYFHLNIFVH